MTDTRKFSIQGTVDRLRPDPTRQVDYRDTKERGLGVRVSPGGTKSYYVSYRINGRQARKKIGTHPYLTLAEARRQARSILSLVDQGKDPAAERLKLGRTSRQIEFGEAVEAYLQKHAFPRTKNAKETQRLLKFYFVSSWRHLRLTDLDRRLVREACADIVGRGAPGAANNAFAALRAMLNWCVAQDLCATSPCSGLQMPAVIRSRDRVLKDQEISAILYAANNLGTYGEIVKLLFLTGQRKSEVAGARRTEIDRINAIWEIPSDRNKASRQHRIPLVPTALALLSRKHHDDSPIFFPARGKNNRTVAGFSKWKRKLDLKSGVTNWRIHDIRRTVATGLAKLGVEPHVIGKILNHADAVTGPTKIYLRHDYMNEARRALLVWEQKLSKLSDPALTPLKTGSIALKAPLTASQTPPTIITNYDDYAVIAANSNESAQ